MEAFGARIEYDVSNTKMDKISSPLKIYTNYSDLYLSVNTRYGLSSEAVYCSFEYDIETHYSGYFFYLPEREKYAENELKDILDCYPELNQDNFCITRVNNPEELTKFWNMIGKDDRVLVTVIRTHADPEGLGFGKSSDDDMQIENINNLEKKNIDTLLLISCNSGHYLYEDNVASAFSKKVTGNVWASDGTVLSKYRGFDLESFILFKNCYSPTGCLEAKDTSAWYIWAKKSGLEYTNNKGWLLYSCMGDKTEYTEYGIYNATIKDLLYASRAKGSVYE